ncbi:uncharacterized protein A1O9_10685, partial [Exophiala aquamarina CBS 119918]
MPNKKSKSGTPKGKGAASLSDSPSLPAVPVVVQPRQTMPSPHPQTQAPPPKGSSSSSEDFWTKNARAKALIMSTLVPGSEPWKIAEPLELASDIWKALEDKYAPKDTKGRLDAKGIIDAAKKSEHGTAENARPLSSDFIGDWVEGKPMDKYLDMYRSSKRAPQPLPEPAEHPSAAYDAPVTDKDAVELAAAVLSQRLPKGPTTPTPSEAQPIQTDSATAAGASSSSWRATPVVHDSYLTEGQALAFAQYDLERKKQIQVAATKVLMQKLPTRDLRFLWAILYGGENAPWPGSSSAIIPGVTVSGGLSTFRL